MFSPKSVDRLLNSGIIGNYHVVTIYNFQPAVNELTAYLIAELLETKYFSLYLNNTVDLLNSGIIENVLVTYNKRSNSVVDRLLNSGIIGNSNGIEGSFLSRKILTAYLIAELENPRAGSFLELLTAYLIAELLETVRI